MFLRFLLLALAALLLALPSIASAAGADLLPPEALPDLGAGAVALVVWVRLGQLAEATRDAVDTLESIERHTERTAYGPPSLPGGPSSTPSVTVS